MPAAQRLHVIMPFYRKQNIEKLANFYLRDVAPHPFELRLHVCVQGPEPDNWGMSKTNEMIDIIKEGWLFTFSDDTLHSIFLFKRLGEIISANPNAGAVVFSQKRPDTAAAYPEGILHAKPENMKPCHVDGGQVAWKRDFLGNDRYERDKYSDQADGNLVRKVFQRDPARFIFCDEVLTGFNSIF